uniref:Uncharacterized protein n=1 Tax=Rhizophora mucronata TaxID=61149 RepID=A0A2P2NWD9_RHIMU
MSFVHMKYKLSWLLFITLNMNLHNNFQRYELRSLMKFILLPC